MAVTRPYWSGQIRISLVTFDVNLFTATRRSAQVPLHEIDRKSGSRIHHQNVTGEGEPVEDKNIVKGFEAAKGEYVLLEDKELAQVKLPSSNSFELESFADIADIPVMRFERPYFVLPDGKNAEEIYGVVAQALQEAGKAGIGQIALRGREELCALLPYDKGLMVETLRYDAELHDPDDIFAHLKERKAKSDYLKLARQLIDQNSGALRLDQYHDRYHEALQKLIAAKKSHRKLRPVKEERKPAKVVNFMDALQRSLKAGKSAPAAKRKTA